MKPFKLDQSEDVIVCYDVLHVLGCKILQQNGASQQIANLVIDELLNNEVSGYESHGILRLSEYIQLLTKDIYCHLASP